MSSLGGYMKNNSKSKSKGLANKSILLILGVVYTLVSILAVSSYVSTMNAISTTPVTIASVLGSVWWQILMIALFGVAYILYTKKPVLGALLEIIMGMAMLVYIIISISLMGIDIVALIIELVYPLILIMHGLVEFKKINKKRKTRKSTI